MLDENFKATDNEEEKVRKKGFKYKLANVIFTING